MRWAREHDESGSPAAEVPYCCFNPLGFASSFLVLTNRLSA
jgi:hypothetical protein